MREGKKKKDHEKRMIVALQKIAGMDKGLKPEIIDWAQVGRNAVYLAREACQEICKECGRVKP